ncbi:MAG: hypothetical protein HQL08_16075, partial [Nitrospirae bacterium]|nr:hypothetical protein [Nitrospirota bacterium]
GHQSFFGVGTDTNIDIASFKAVIGALNRAPDIRRCLTEHGQKMEKQ